MRDVIEIVGVAGTFISLLAALLFKLRSTVEKRLDKAYNKIECMHEALEDMTMRALMAEAKLEAYYESHS